MFLRALKRKYPETVVVSGGARGVDTTAEKVWLRLGGQVISLRPRKVEERRWVIDRWELGGAQPRCWTPDYYLEWADFPSAATWRNLLIVEETHRGVAFWDGRSWGTSCARALYADAEKPCHTFYPR